jgi:formylglycine-generating enzyme required for sulfatase activity
MGVILNSGLALAKVETFKDCPTCPEMVVIPAGSFQMGGRGRYEKPIHRVEIKSSFAVGKFEITQAEWQSVMGENPSSFEGSHLPVEQVSWDDAHSYIEKLNAKTGQTYRLLTEAEWEYVARAGTTTGWMCGKTKDCVEAFGWYRGISDRKPHPVGQKQPNAFGLYDIIGNVREWVEDCYQPNYEGLPADGTAKTVTGDCQKRSVRGGSWHYLPKDLQSSNRHAVFAVFKLNELGFRVARGM